MFFFILRILYKNHVKPNNFNFMKKVLTLLGIGLLCLTLNTFAGNYTVDQSKIDAMIENATDVTAVSAFDMSGIQALPMQASQLDEKDPIIAFLLTATAGVGVAGIHRLYLGTETMTFIVYLLTLGGCGIIQTVDAIMLLLVLIDDEKSLSPYVDNGSILMWKDQM